MDTVHKATLAMAEDCRKFGTRSRLSNVLGEVLWEQLPDDCAEKCSGRTHVAVTYVSPLLKGELVNTFESKDDLINCLLTSCHIPGYVAANVFTKFRGRTAIDGGLTNFIPTPPTEVSVKVTCFPAKNLGSIANIAISPDLEAGWDIPFDVLVRCAFAPGPEDFLDELRAKGKRDAKLWAGQSGLLDYLSGSKEEEGGELDSANPTSIII